MDSHITTNAVRITYTYAGSSTTLDQLHYYTGYTLDHRQRWIIDNMRWNSHIYIRWIIDNAGSSTTLDHRQNAVDHRHVDDQG